MVPVSGEYLDSDEVYQALTDYIISYLKTDTGFSKLLYKYMLQEDTISGEELCLVLYEQGVLSKEDELYQSLSKITEERAFDGILRQIIDNIRQGDLKPGEKRTEAEKRC